MTPPCPICLRPVPRREGRGRPRRYHPGACEAEANRRATRRRKAERRATPDHVPCTRCELPTHVFDVAPATGLCRRCVRELEARAPEPDVQPTPAADLAAARDRAFARQAAWLAELRERMARRWELGIDEVDEHGEHQTRTEG